MDRRKNNEPSRVTIYNEGYFMAFMIPLLLARRYKILHSDIYSEKLHSYAVHVIFVNSQLGDYVRNTCVGVVRRLMRDKVFIFLVISLLKGFDCKQFLRYKNSDYTLML